MHPYLRLMRFDRPVPIWLLLWPTLWALWIASHGQPPFSILIIFVCGVVITRALGCVVNDIADRNIDLEVRRTRHRPLARKEISLTSAIVLAFILASLALICVLFLNTLSLFLSVMGLGVMLFYPFAKRFTYFPQLILGFAFGGLPVLMVFAATENSLLYVDWLLYVAAVLWPVAYDTMYALADREDDLRIGVKSTAILFADYDRIFIVAMQAIFIALFVLIGWVHHFHLIFYLAVGIAALLCVYQQFLLQFATSENYLRAFANNDLLGLVLFVGIFLEYCLYAH